jgi:DNA invertase Pin-like site-specific DNA recombinase
MKPKRAISYIRFSDSKQAKGRSKQRQLKWGSDLCASKGWLLDDSLKLHDLGVSAFRGENAARGHLAKFLEAIKACRVKAGDVLLLESLDRLSRDDIDPSWELFRSILKAGVEIYTREPERHYQPADLNNFGTRIEVQAYFLRAFNESATKSMRGLDYWKSQRNKLASGKPIHKVLPAWLRLSADKQRFEVREDAAKAVRLIYSWAAAGEGQDPILAKLNQRKIPPIGNNIRREVMKTVWSRSYIGKLLRDKAVCGEFQPHVMKDGKRVPFGEPIKNYFPAIITEKDWYRTRHAVKERGRELGPKGIGIASLFTGLIRDARDGKTMHLVYAGSSRKANTRQLISYGTRNAEPGSVHMPFAYDAFEKAFLQVVRELKASDLLNPAQDADREMEIASLSGKIDELDKKIALIQRRVGAESSIETLVTLLESLDAERKQALGDRERLKVEAGHQQSTALSQTRSMIELLEKTPSGEPRKELRLKIRGRIKQLVSEIWMFVWNVTPKIRAVEAQVIFHSGKVKGILLMWLRRGKYRGMIEGGGGIIRHEDSQRAIPLLSKYRSDSKVRRWFAGHHERLNPVIVDAIEASKKARDAIDTAEEALSKRR